MLRLFSQDNRSSIMKYLDRRNRSFIPEEVRDTVREIVQRVKTEGDSAVLEYCRKFDNAKGQDSFRISTEALRSAAEKADDQFIEAIGKSIDNVKRFQSLMVDKNISMMTENGGILGSRVTPIDRAAIYVPGGKAAYPSTLVMCAVPAIVAGVREIIVLTPPLGNGSIDPYLAATAGLLGIDSIFGAGGAQGVAAAAFGTETIPRVDKIAGPGNAYVTAAKREVYGYVDIDMIAGPSEIAVIADSGADPCWVAADILSQAEHDEMASCFLITDSEALAVRVNAEIERQLGGMKRRDIISKALENNSAVILVGSIGQSAEIINEIAPEHLEIITENPFRILRDIRNAGAIFIGAYSTEPMGDYIAGPSHVLPTYGTAAFFSPLSARDFQKRSSLICCSKQDMAEYGPAAVRIAEAEGLKAHANALKVRLGDNE